MGSHSVTCHPTEATLVTLPLAFTSTHYTIPQRVESWVDLGTAGKVQQPVPKTCVSRFIRKNSHENGGGGGCVNKQCVTDSVAVRLHPMVSFVICVCILSIYFQQYSFICYCLCWERLGLDDIISVLQQNRLRWYGHVLQKEDNDWVKKYMENEMDWRVPGQEVDQRKLVKILW